MEMHAISGSKFKSDTFKFLWQVISCLWDKVIRDEILLWACMKRKTTLARYVLKLGANVMELDNKGRTALIIASSCGNDNEDIVRMLIRYKADVNAQDNDGNTALILASRRGSSKIVKALLEVKGINIDKRNRRKWTAIMRAAQKKHSVTFKLLFDKGADPLIRNISGHNAIDFVKQNIAAFNGTEALSILKEKGYMP